MATHSSILAWRIPWTEEPGRLPSMASQRVGQDWATKQPSWEGPSPLQEPSVGEPTFCSESARSLSCLRIPGWLVQTVGPHVGGCPCGPDPRPVPPSLHAPGTGCPPRLHPPHWPPLRVPPQHIPALVSVCSQASVLPLLVLWELLFVSSEKQPSQYLLTDLCCLEGLVLPTSEETNMRKRELLPSSHQTCVGKEETLRWAHG